MSTVDYIPALRFKWLTPLYDFIVGHTMPEKKIKEHLIRVAEISDGQQVLDFGCGTGSLTIMAKEANPGATITGIDIDIQILNKAIQRAEKKNLDILLIDYNGIKLPFHDNQFNKVISCLVFHHLDTGTKQKVLAGLFRTLSSGGRLHIADFGLSASWLQRKLFNIIRILDGFKPTRANAEGMLPELIEKAGFKNVSVTRKFKTIFGEVQLFNATKQ